MVTTTETHEIDRRDGKITVAVTYTPRGGKPLRMYSLKLHVTGVTGSLSPNVFVYQRSTDGAPMEDGSPRDEFVCVADELDENEIPTSEEDMVKAGVPYYRVDTVELLFRNSDMMYETARALLASISE